MSTKILGVSNFLVTLNVILLLYYRNRKLDVDFLETLLKILGQMNVKWIEVLIYLSLFIYVQTIC